MSKRVLICIGIAVAAIAAAFLFYKQELTKKVPEEDLEQDLEEDLSVDPRVDEKNDVDNQGVEKTVDEISSSIKTKGQIFAEKMQAARDAKKQTVGAVVNEQ